MPEIITNKEQLESLLGKTALEACMNLLSS